MGALLLNNFDHERHSLPNEISSTTNLGERAKVIRFFFSPRLTKGTCNLRYHLMETNVFNLVAPDVNGGEKITNINQF